MNHIPTEVLHEIFIKLTLKDKLECTLVCRRWHDALEKRSLLHKLIISTRVFHKLKAMIERQPHRATQVEYLRFQGRYAIAFDKRILCNLFPNLQEIKLPSNLCSDSTSNYLDTPFKFTHPTSKLNKIADSGRCELAPQLAMSNLCNNLKSLDLTFIPRSLYDFSQLQNIPVLETFTLRRVRVNLMDLEMIHRNLPSIKRLYLRYADISAGEVPRDVIPASLVTEFGLHLGSEFNLRLSFLHGGELPIQLYKYFAKKYPSVHNPAIDSSMLKFMLPDVTRKVYNEGILPLYKNIGPHANSFYFKNYCQGLDVFRKFDEYGAKLKRLTIDSSSDENLLFIEELVQSQQSQSIQKLNLKNIVPEPLEMTSNMKALRYLEVDCSDGYAFSQEEEDESYMRKFDFNQLIAACPEQLIRLTIKGVKLTFNKSTSNKTSIRSLELVNVDINSATTITERSFPKLTAMHLDTTVTSNLTISLPQNHLKEVAIHIKYPKGEECGLSVNTMYEDKPHSTVMWPTLGGGTSGLLYGSNKPTSESAAKNMVDLTCASIEQMSYSIAQKEEKSYDEEDDDYY